MSPNSDEAPVPITEDLVRYVGLHPEGGEAARLDDETLHKVISVKLAAQGFDTPNQGDGLLGVASDLFRVYREQSRLLESHLCPVDQRVQNFLDDALKSTGESVKLPSTTLSVDRFGLARELSFPEGGNEFSNSEIKSYRLAKGSVLHNPIQDKRVSIVRQ